jgi:DNA modification methylase
MLAFALRADGWYLRSEIIWHRPNPMPESVTDRPTKSHSTVFLLSKQPRYFYDADAIRVPFSDNTHSRGKGIGVKQEIEANGGTKHAGRNNASFGRATMANLSAVAPQEETLDGSAGESPRGPDGRRATAVVGQENSEQHRNGERWPNVAGANARSVWTIPTEATPFAHFATWPQKLVERMIQAGCPDGGIVLDPFGGSGTTALVARRLGRRSVLIEISEDYCALAAKRLSQQSLLTEAAAIRSAG